MDDLRARLEEALGAQYAIQRELGGGGMSRVFLAEETALGRRVVLKVLPPDMAAVLSADRFQREARLAAGLQHPHIVPLLAAGVAGDVLYYTMPFVEGESLRARLSREGALPVPEAARLLREVADALAYAHRQGIVHRDIKPDNVLLSTGHAVVTDFGIAKALTAAGAGGSLTATGVAVGTPAYMAPEQATGEATVDHRADLYALGAMAYEMLTGETPFRGPTAQALIAAQLTRTPAPVTDIRPNVPPALSAAVARCLEKLPADRYQHAEDLLAALDAAATTAAVTVATGQAPAVQAARAWPLPQVLGLFGVAAASVLGLAWGLRTLLGLPDWFFPAAVTLVALGLPIVLAAALLHNRRAGGRATPTAPLARHLSLAGAVRGGVLALGGLGVATGGYMAMRVLGIGPVGSLVASGKLNARERLIIADFADQTPGKRLGAAVTQAFRVDFAQSRLISPVEPDYVRRVLRRMQRSDSTPIDLTVAREIAQREGWKAVVAGELQQVGPSVLVSAELVSADSGTVLATARETARDSTGILDAVDRVSRKLRERIGESLRTIRAGAPLADVTTGSLEALRKYSQAIQVQGQGDNPGAIALLEETVALDSGFAMAWRKLGTMLTNQGERPARAEQALTRAFGLRDRLTFRERKLTENSYYSDARGLQDSAMAALQSLLAEYPDDSWALNNLGVGYELAGNVAEAERSYTRAAQLEPENILAWGNIFTLRIGAARFDSAAATLREMHRRFPPGPAMDFRDALLDLGRRDFDSAEARLRVLVPRYQSNPAWHDQFLNQLAGVLAIRGKLAEADRALNTLAELRTGRGDAGGALDAELLRIVPVGVLRGDQKAAKSALDALLRAHPPDRMPELERPMSSLIRAAVSAGDRETAGRFLEEFGRNRGNLPARVWDFVHQSMRGEVLAMRKETLPQAFVAFRTASATCAYCVDPQLALGFEQAGMTDSALAHFQHWADVGENIWEGGVYWHWAPVVYFRLGELYEARGDKEHATEYYGKFADLWKEADAEFQPRVKEAKRRIADLVAEPSGQRIGVPPKKP